MNRSVTRSVLSPRSKTSSGCSPRQPRLSVGGAGKKATSSRSTDTMGTPARRVSEEEFSRFEKKLDILCQLNSADDRVTVEKLEQKLKMKNEELEAALCELDETKTSLAHMERKFQQAQKVSERLEKENKAQAAQLDEIRKELMDRRRKSIINRKVLDEKNGENTPPPPSPQNTDTDDENMGNLLLKQGLKREEQLAEEVKKLKEQVEKGKADYSAAIKDMLVAVKVAVGLKEEAEAELSRIQARALDDGSDAIWANLIRRWNGGTKRHSLLIWAQYKLTPYPSINVANFTDDWKDGKAFCALVHAHRPDLVTRSQLQGECNELVEKLAASLALDDVKETLFSTAPDWNRVMNVVFSLYRKFSEEDA